VLQKHYVRTYACLIAYPVSDCYCNHSESYQNMNLSQITKSLVHCLIGKLDNYVVKKFRQFMESGDLSYCNLRSSRVLRGFVW
jgi:hypothetical protein